MAPPAVVDASIHLQFAALPSLLAQDTAGGAVSIIGWSLVLFAFIVLAFWGVVLLRRWMRTDATPAGGTGFGLSELREMHRRGQLTDEEYERARGKITSAAKAVTSQMPSPAGGRRAPGAAGPAPATPSAAGRAVSPAPVVPPPVEPAEAPRPVVRAEPVPTLDPIPLEGGDDDRAPMPDVSGLPPARSAQQPASVERPEAQPGGAFDPIPLEDAPLPNPRTSDRPRPDKSDADAAGR